MQSATVLIVEDEILVGLMLEETLSDAGFTVVGVYRLGTAALDHMKKEAVDLLIVDVVLHGDLSGIDLARAVRAFWAGPIMFHTSASDPEIRRQMAAIPNATMLFKPTSITDLVQAVRGLLELPGPPHG